MAYLKDIPSDQRGIDCVIVVAGQLAFVRAKYDTGFIAEVRKADPGAEFHRSAASLAEIATAFDEHVEPLAKGLPVSERKAFRQKARNTAKLIRKASVKTWTLSADRLDSLREAIEDTYDQIAVLDAKSAFVELKAAGAGINPDDVDLSVLPVPKVNEDFLNAIKALSCPPPGNVQIVKQGGRIQFQGDAITFRPIFGDGMWERLLGMGAYRHDQWRSTLILPHDNRAIKALAEADSREQYTVNLEVLQYFGDWRQQLETLIEDERRAAESVQAELAQVVDQAKFNVPNPVFKKGKQPVGSKTPRVELGPSERGILVTMAYRDGCFDQLKYLGWNYRGNGQMSSSDDPVGVWEGIDYIAAQHQDYLFEIEVIRRLQDFRNSYENTMLARAESESLSRGVESDVEHVVPAGLKYRNFQNVGISFHILNKSVINGDEMGLGKTIQSLGTINAVPTIRSVLIVCPQSLKFNWRKESVKWLLPERGVSIGMAEGDDFPDTDVVIINYDILRRHAHALRERDWDMIITDEGQYLKNPKSQRTIAIFGGEHKGEYFEPLSAEFKIWLSGTPFPNRTRELWGAIDWLRPGLISEKDFLFKFCGPVRGDYGWTFDGSSNHEEFQDFLRQNLMIRRLKSEVAKDLPTKTRQLIDFSPSRKMQKLMQVERSAHENVVDAVAEAALALARGDRAAHNNAILKLQPGPRTPFSELARARHELAVMKAPFVGSFIEENFVENGEKVILFAHHREVLEYFKERFGDKAVLFYGGMSSKAKESAKDRFQNDDDCLIFLGSIKAAGVGLTLTASSSVVFAEFSYVPGDLDQAEDRAHRIGQNMPVLCVYPVLIGSLDAEMLSTVAVKAENQDRMLDRNHEAVLPTSIADIGFEPGAGNVFSVETDMPTTATKIGVGGYDFPSSPAPLGEVAGRCPSETGATKGETVHAAPSRPGKSPGLLVQSISVASGLSFEDLDNRAHQIDPDDIPLIHEALQELSSVCDYAQDLDGQGFNKPDAMLGNFLAGLDELTPQQAVLGREMVATYRKQIPFFYEAIYNPKGKKTKKSSSSARQVASKEFLLDSYPALEEFVTEEYITGLLASGRWSPRGDLLDRFFEEMSPMASSAREILENWLPQRYAYVTESILNEIEHIAGLPALQATTLPVYRTMNVPMAWAESLACGEVSAGLFWGTEGPVAHGFADDGQDGVEVCLSASVGCADIDWIETLRSRFDWSYGEEGHEIHIKPGISIRLDNVYVNGVEHPEYEGLVVASGHEDPTMVHAACVDDQDGLAPC